MSYDSARGVTVLFGGLDDFHKGDTWEWNGTTWTLRSTTGPSPRQYHAMVYDIARGITVLFGGIGSSSLGDTWEWDGTTWTLRSTTGPSARWGHAMAYDGARGVTVLFGGYSGSYPFEGDTWEWDGATWTLRSITGSSPRGFHAMAYDSARGVTVLFGGLFFTGFDVVELGDTWEWDGTTWTPRSTTGPSPRRWHAMGYDSARGVTVLFGGFLYNGGVHYYYSDTWEWDGTTWTLRSTSGASPRSRHAMAYDSARGATVLFGGYGGSLKGDTWEWDGTTWTLRSTTGPSSRLAHAMAYDGARAVTVLFGGDYISGQVQADTWEWDGTTWTQRSLTGPSPRSGHAMSYDSARGVTVLFGGNDDSVYSSYNYKRDTWEWNGTTWTQRSLTGPSPRSAHAMAYDSARRVTVLFGGLYYDSGFQRFGDTWEWDGTAWTLRSTTGPSPRYAHAMAYDSARRVTVLFGGSGSGDTWEWNGTTWTLRSTTGPSPRSQHAMAYDSARGVTVLFGVSSGLGDTWEWSGTTWTLRSLTGPSWRWSHAMAYDSARGVTVLFGGYDSSYPYDKGDTWELAYCAVVSGLSIAPGGATDFGSIAIGATADRGFTLRNTGSNSIVGNASAPAPFSVVSGASYNLASGQTQAVTVRYSPTQPGNNIAYITFTGTGTQQRQLLGSAFATPTFASIRGTVTNADSTAPLSGIRVTINGATHTDAEGKYAFDAHPGCCYSVRASDPFGRVKPQQVDQITAATGSPTVVDFALVPQQQAPDLPPEQYPVLLVSGFSCESYPYNSGTCVPDPYPDPPYLCGSEPGYCEKQTWQYVRDALSAAEFGADYIWDPNRPEPDVLGGAGFVIDGRLTIDTNWIALENYIRDKVKQFHGIYGYYPAKINIVASSMGGLIVRRLLHRNSNKLLLPIMLEGADRYVEVRVDKVIMLGTPNAGTPLADHSLSANVLSPFFCDWNFAPDSLDNISTDYVRDIFNPNHPWPTGVKLYLHAGTSVDENSCGSLRWGSWFNIRLLNLSAAEEVNDGAVPEPSVRGVYHKRRITFSIPPLTYEPIQSFAVTPTSCNTVPLDHFRLKQDTTAVAWIVNILKERPVTIGSCNSPPAAVASAAQGSSAPLQQIDGSVGALGTGETAQVTIPCDANSNLQVVASMSTVSVPVTLLDPSGSPVSPSDTESDPPIAFYDIVFPVPGNWTLVFDGSSLPAGTADYGFGAFGDSDLALVPSTNVAFLNGEEAIVSCFLGVFDDLAGFSPVAGGNVTAVVTAPDATDMTLVLLDDGLHSDGLADDGTYAAVFTNTAQAGSYRLRYRADGTAGGPLTNDAGLPLWDAERPSFVKGGLAFRRVALGTFGVSSAAARISGNLTDEAVDFDADGFADFLRVQFWVTAQQAGTYLASGLVVDETGGSSIAGSETALELPIGTSTVSVLFDCRKLAAPGTYGPFSLQNLELFERRDDRIAWVDRYREAYALATGQIEIPCPPFDGDCDGDLDLGDIATFQRCFSPGVPAEAECERFDPSGDEGVDLSDFAGLRGTLTGPMTPPGP